MPGPPAFIDWIRTLPCCVPKCPAKADPHHSTTGTKNGLRRGKGQRSEDEQTIPLCRDHHDQFHDLRGRFKGWTKPQIREWQAEQVARYHALYFETFGEKPWELAPSPSKILPRLPPRKAEVIDLDAFRTQGLHAVPNLIVWVSSDADDVSMHENVEEHLTSAQAEAIANKLLALAGERK